MDDDGISIEAAANASTGEPLARWITATVFEDAEGMPAERSVNGAELPSLTCDPTEMRNIRKFVDPGQIEVEAHVLVAESAAILKIRVSQCGATHRIVVVDLWVVSLTAAV